MNRKCDLLDDCGYFRRYQDHRSEAIDVWKKLFCMDMNYSKKCKRKQIFRETGEAPPDNMSPTGELFDLSDE
jgi:hypothetical protein